MNLWIVVLTLCIGTVTMNELRKQLSCPSNAGTDFFASSKAIFLFHVKAPVLIVKRSIATITLMSVKDKNGVVTFERTGDILRTHFYMGIISPQANNLFSEFGGACVPTSRFAESPDYLPKVDHLVYENGHITAERLGGDIDRQFHERIGDDYGLNYFIGTKEVGEWLRNKGGLYPYVHRTFSRALDYPLPIAEAPALQLVA